MGAVVGLAPGERTGVKVDAPGLVVRPAQRPVAGDEAGAAEILPQAVGQSAVAHAVEAVGNGEFGIGALDRRFVEGVPAGACRGVSAVFSHWVLYWAPEVKGGRTLLNSSAARSESGDFTRCIKSSA